MARITPTYVKPQLFNVNAPLPPGNITMDRELLRSWVRLRLCQASNMEFEAWPGVLHILFMDETHDAWNDLYFLKGSNLDALLQATVQTILTRYAMAYANYPGEESPS